MKSSTTIAAIAAALAKAQPLIEGAIKDKDNPGFKGAKYADLGNVVEVIKAGIKGSGLSFLQMVHDDRPGVAVETIILHESGEWISGGVLAVPVNKNDAQGYGSALTYARRYSLSAAFGVAPEDDDGNAAAKAPPAPVVLISLDQATQLDDLITEVEADRANFLKYLKVEKLEDLPAAHFEHAVKKLEAKRKPPEAA